MSIVHLIKDEGLGGIEREYVEVDRKAKVGDYVYVKNCIEIPNINGKITKCTNNDDFDDGSIDVDLPSEEYGDYTFLDSECDIYKTLEPTDIVHIDGNRFQMVNRKAEIGEKVLIVNNEGIPGHNGLQGEVVFEYNGDVLVDTESLDYFPYVFESEYRVLGPVDNADEELVGVDETQASPEVLDLLANLARRVTAIERVLKTPTPFATQAEITGVNKRLDSVEQQLRDTQGNVERLAEEIAAGKPVVINTSNITVNENVDVERIMQALAARLGGMSR